MELINEVDKAKSKPKRSKTLLVVALVLFVVATAIFLFPRNASRAIPSENGYYKGPMMNKKGTAYVTDDGRVVPTPPGEKEPTGNHSATPRVPE